jgi:hypothetical protein
MFFVITNIYNKKTKGTTLMEIFKSTAKLNKFFWQLEMFDMCTTGDTAHIDKIFKFLPYTRQHGCIDILHFCNDPCLKAGTCISYRCVPCYPWCTHQTSLVVKKTCSGFLWLWRIPLRYVLWFSCYKFCNHGEHYETPCTDYFIQWNIQYPKWKHNNCRAY